MTLTQMRYFSTICECKNISVAAKLLYVSQPALSATMASLEEEVGFKLFQRKSKGVYPTEEGLQLLSHVDAVLRRMDLLEREVPLIAKNQNLIQVGFRPYGGENVFFQVYRDFERDHKDIVLKVHEMSNYTPYVFLEEKVIDFLVASKSVVPKEWRKRYECRRIGTERPRIFCHRDSELAHRGVLELEDLAACPFVFWEGQQHLLERLTTALEEKGLHMNVIAIVPQITGILHFVYNNLAVGFLAGDYLEAITSIQEIPIHGEALKMIGEPLIPIYAFWKRDIERYHGKKLFIDYLRRRAAEAEDLEEDEDDTDN